MIMDKAELLSLFINECQSQVSTKTGFTTEWNVQYMNVYMSRKDTAAISIQTTTFGPWIIRSYWDEKNVCCQSRFSISEKEYQECKAAFLQTSLTIFKGASPGPSGSGWKPLEF